ncbi:hypothetical protein ABT106_31680, partial [Streptomyces sp. NPDC002044]
MRQPGPCGPHAREDARSPVRGTRPVRTRAKPRGGIDERAAFEAITPGKDVDGVTMHSFAAMGFGL